MPQVIGTLDAANLTSVVNRDGKNHRFLTELLFPRSTWIPRETTTVQVDEMTYNPIMAPFVEAHEEGVMLPRPEGSSYAVTMPYISLKQPLSATKELLQRRAGQSTILIAPGERADVITSNLNRAILQDVRTMNDSIEEREEWMVAQGLIGTMTYSVANRASFQLTLAKPVGNTITPAVYWDQANPTPHQDLQTVKEVQSDNDGPIITDGICSRTAARAIYAMIETEELKLDETRGVDYGGRVSAFANQFSDEGVLYIGRINSIDFWEYAQSVKDEDGTETKLIRSGYIEFVSRTRKARQSRELNYGPILDIRAIRARKHITRRYAWSKVLDDPSVYMQYVKSSPLPLPKRPDWNISFRAVAA
jgi:hypothetical protein